MRRPGKLSSAKVFVTAAVKASAGVFKTNQFLAERAGGFGTSRPAVFSLSDIVTFLNPVVAVRSSGKRPVKAGARRFRNSAPHTFADDHVESHRLVQRWSAAVARPDGDEIPRVAE